MPKIEYVPVPEHVDRHDHDLVIVLIAAMLDAYVKSEGITFYYFLKQLNELLAKENPYNEN